MINLKIFSRLNKVPHVFFLLMGLLIITFYACEELPCTHTDGVKLNAGFFTIDNSILREVSFDSLTMYLANNIEDPYFEEHIRPLNKLAIPLSINSDTTTLVLKYKDKTADTIVFHYQRSVVLINHQCGFDTFFQLDTITSTHYKIESIWISKETIDYGKAENIKIYF